MKDCKSLTFFDIDVILAAEQSDDTGVIVRELARVLPKIEYDAERMGLGRDYVETHPIVGLLADNLLRRATGIKYGAFQSYTNYAHEKAVDGCLALRKHLYEMAGGKPRQVE